MPTNDPLLRLHKNEIDGLNNLLTCAKSACDYLRRLFQAIRDDKSSLALASIDEFLGHSPVCSPLRPRMDEFGHLINPVGIPTRFPSTPRGDGIPSLAESRTASSAHGAALGVSKALKSYFGSKAYGLNLRPEAKFEIEDAPTELVYNLWQEIRNDLDPVCEFDVDALAKAIDEEHQLAIERCRASVVSNSSGIVPDPPQPAARLDSPDTETGGTETGKNRKVGGEETLFSDPDTSQDDDEDAKSEGIPQEFISELHRYSFIAEMHSGVTQANPSQYVVRAEEDATMVVLHHKKGALRIRVDVRTGFSQEAKEKLLKPASTEAQGPQ